ncbi:hypothetical protein [Algoriphagus zhangzhouensis]|uniref:MotA/TolQ/ExbB proton channel family protein n=1 Tax=Algoriphagus zhangzhouensis TaxID=1073327 RepID=A0A1M7ZAQ2_9BACT|nr:hypothetical protein [Algoriphagus zhangzhouensis]TDY47152.1 hypothetical protein A8938_1604 [Algoriphagus zhangzhouensis]SHO61889.1 hypothetical protein SAMN04488108_1658 [Algoriphagus zhangzhouensis]
MNVLSISWSLVLGFNIIDRFQDGGTLGMTLVLLCLLVAIFFSFKAFTGLAGPEAEFSKNKKLIQHAALLGLVISFMNSLLALIGAFDAIEAAGDIAPDVLAGGLKITLLSPLFGLLVFVIGHISSFVLTWMRKAELETDQ